jgi:prophage regulatory protein
MIENFSSNTSGSHYEIQRAFGRREELCSYTRSKTSISSGFPEQGGGGASADIEAEKSIAGNEAPTVSASDDDGDSDDGDPDRRSINKLINHNSKAGPKPVSLAINPSDHALTRQPSSLCAQAHLSATTSAGDSPSPQNLDIALWRLPTVLAHVPVSRSHWWAGVAEGRYPAPVKLSKRCVAWRSADIRALIASF